MAVAVSVSKSLRSVLKDSTSGVGREEYCFVHLERDAGKKRKKVPIGQIYKESMLSRLNFFRNYKIMSVRKKRFLFQNKQQDFYLLTRDDIRKHKKTYDFLHIGFVQACFIPYFPRGVDHRIIVCLRDTKHSSLKSSILAAFVIDLWDGVTTFNWFPHFSVSLSDLLNSNGLVITVEPVNVDLKEDCYGFAISYRMCYKLMKGCLEPRSQFENPMLELETERVVVLAPRISTTESTELCKSVSECEH